MKKLYKVEQGKMICGVCGGIAEYFDLDPSLIRIAAVILACLGGGGLLAYIVAAVVLPKKSDLKL
ncbi:MAG: PspC domain-containing protein [Oscillospiraceae bacterium]|nr:PspC domain-containing protein [Oscillospiraceae bacterium]